MGKANGQVVAEERLGADGSVPASTAEMDRLSVQVKALADRCSAIEGMAAGAAADIGRLGARVDGIERTVEELVLLHLVASVEGTPVLGHGPVTNNEALAKFEASKASIGAVEEPPHGVGKASIGDLGGDGLPAHGPSAERSSETSKRAEPATQTPSGGVGPSGSAPPVCFDASPAGSPRSGNAIDGLGPEQAAVVRDYARMVSMVDGFVLDGRAYGDLAAVAGIRKALDEHPCTGELSARLLAVGRVLQMLADEPAHVRSARMAGSGLDDAEVARLVEKYERFAEGTCVPVVDRWELPAVAVEGGAA